jgi:hypothetical protein
MMIDLLCRLIVNVQLRRLFFLCEFFPSFVPLFVSNGYLAAQIARHNYQQPTKETHEMQ